MAEQHTIELTRQYVKRMGMNPKYYPCVSSRLERFKDSAQDGAYRNGQGWTVVGADELVSVPSRNNDGLLTCYARITETRTYTIDTEPM